MAVCALVILGICSQRQLLGIMPISVKKPWPRISNYLILCPHVYREVQVKNIRLPNVGKGMQIFHFSKIHSFLSTNCSAFLAKRIAATVKPRSNGPATNRIPAITDANS